MRDMVKYEEYGGRNQRTVMLLHGGGLAPWNYRKAAEMLQSDFRVILPVLDGHAGSDCHFTTIESNAAEMIAFIRENLGGTVELLGGLSLGGQILLEMLSQQGDICRHALIESAMVIPAKLTHALAAPAFGCSYPLIRQKWFAKLQFRQLRMDADYFADYYRDTCAVEKADMIALMKANTSYQLKKSAGNCPADVHIYYGEKESSGIRHSAACIHSALPESILTELPGMYHGDFSINHPEMYVRAIREICGDCPRKD